MEALEAQGDAYRARKSFKEVERRQQEAFSELHQLEASLESTHETRALDEKALDLPLMELTDEEIVHHAATLDMQRHWEKIRKLDEKIAAFSPP